MGGTQTLFVSNSTIYIFQWGGLLYLSNIMFYVLFMGLTVMGQFSRYHYDKNRVSNMIIPILANAAMTVLLMTNLTDTVCCLLKSVYVFWISGIFWRRSDHLLRSSHNNGHHCSRCRTTPQNIRLFWIPQSIQTTTVVQIVSNQLFHLICWFSCIFLSNHNLYLTSHSILHDNHFASFYSQCYFLWR